MTAVIDERRHFQWTHEQFEQMHELGWFAGQEVELIDGEVFVQEEPDVRAKRLWTSSELYQMLDLGWFQDRRVELIAGEVLEVASQKNYHGMSLSLSQQALERVFGLNYWVRNQLSLDLSPRSTPDPDLAVIPGSISSGDPNANPTSALLIVEVSDSSLYYDRNAKGSLYAAAGIADYWIVNLVHRQLEVYRNAAVDNTALHGYSYADKTFLHPGDFATPLALPSAQLWVADLIP